MTTTYTKITKASGTVYTNVSTGVVEYDDSTVIYDSPTVSYDGLFNQTAYTNISKASGTVYTKITKAT